MRRKNSYQKIDHNKMDRYLEVMGKPTIQRDVPGGIEYRWEIDNCMVRMLMTDSGKGFITICHGINTGYVYHISGEEFMNHIKDPEMQTRVAFNIDLFAQKESI